jgi:hypothetical protein
MATIIKVLRVVDLVVRYVDGQKILVPLVRMVRPEKLENYDIDYDAAGNKQLIRREW